MAGLRLKVKNIDILTGRYLVGILNEKDATDLGLHSGDRIKIKKGKKELVVAVDLTKNDFIVMHGEIGLFGEAFRKLGLKSGEDVLITYENKPKSIDYIKEKLEGIPLTEQKIREIISDIVENKLTEVELTYFVSSTFTNKLTKKETEYLTKAIVETGEILKFDKTSVIADKHCIGGVAGNRTTMLVVPIIASAGIKIPKTSSRSITSPAGTADTMEVLANIELTSVEIQDVVNQTNGCMVWGGALNLAPADDKIINVERPLHIDADEQMVASVIGKKKSASATHLIIVLPYGKGAKIETIEHAKRLKELFMYITKSNSINIKTKVLMQHVKSPIGRGIGPALEARDILWILEGDSRAPQDLRNCSVDIASELLELTHYAKKGEGRSIADWILRSGRAHEKMLEIIEAQGKKIEKSEEIKIGRFKHDVKCKLDLGNVGKVEYINNKVISKIAKYAGAPNDKGAGIYIEKRDGEIVKDGDVLYTIYADKKEKLDYVVELINKKTFDDVVINGFHKTRIIGVVGGYLITTSEKKNKKEKVKRIKTSKKNTRIKNHKIKKVHNKKSKKKSKNNKRR